MATCITALMNVHSVLTKSNGRLYLTMKGVQSASYCKRDDLDVVATGKLQALASPSYDFLLTALPET